MKRTLLPLLATAVLIGPGCLKDPDYEKLSSNLVVATNTAEGVNFSDYHTYYISDSVGVISETLSDTMIKNASSQKLVDAVKQNMNALGYTFVTKANKPDLGINMIVIKDVDVATIYGGWWAGYPGYWDPWYWGWYYPYYYPWSVSYVIRTGSVVVDLVDVKNATANNALKVQWTSVMAGAIGTDLNANIQRGVDAINQSFAQTPELKKN
jgi:hypothetical protein